MGNLIPIKRVSLREENLKYGSNEHFTTYPLYKSCNEVYNFQNLKESIYAWNLYSDNVGNNLEKVIDLLEVVHRYGTQEQLDEAVTIVNESIVPYLQSPTFFSRILEKRPEKHVLVTPVREALSSIRDTILEEVECDRVLKNHSIVSKRFNIDKVIRDNILYEDSVTDTIYSLCSLIDTYNMDLKSKFCTTAELGLYCIGESGSDLPEKRILEEIVDYFMIYHGTKNIDSFVDTIREATEKDMFIDSDIVNEYLDYISSINERVESELQNFDEQMIKKYNNPNELFDESFSNLSKSLKALCEISFIDKAKDMITKIKLAPVKTQGMVKETIRSFLVPTRLQDIKAGTHNSLSLLFYSAITVPFIALGPITALMGVAASMILAKKMNSKYLNEAIQEWRDHKYSVQRKIDECINDPEKKHKLEEYLSSIEENIKLLENKLATVKMEEEKDAKKGFFGLNAPKEKPRENVRRDYMVDPSGKYHEFESSPGGSTSSSSNSSSNSSSSNKNDDEDDDSDIDEYINKIKSE